MANDKVQAGLLQPGVIVGDSYRVESLIGKGGMGEVWAARQLRLANKRVAIKVLRTQGEGLSEEALGRFRREAEIVSRLDHPHIVNFFDYNFTPEGSPYMVMEFLEGESLGTKLRREGCLSLAQTRTIVRQICSALEMAHRLGIIHRDLKPDNIFLATRGHELCVKVLDFGISKFLNANTQLTTDGVVVGSLNYISPEQALGENSQLSPQSDIFSLGSMTYQMLTGKHAFEGNDFRQVVLRLVHASPTPLNQRLSDLPLGAQRAIEKALEKKPEKRHASAMAFSEALDAADLRPPEFISNSSGKAENAADALIGNRVASSRDRWPILFYLLLVVAVLNIVVMYFLLDGGRHEAAAVASAESPPPDLVREVPPPPAETLADVASPETAPLDAPQASDDSVGPGNSKTSPTKAATPPPTPAAAEAPRCPEQMRRILGGSFKMGTAKEFCIDIYEYPNQFGHKPLVNVGWAQAQEYCKEQGKRLCTEAEWEKACRGGQGWTWPYGNVFNRSTCNVADEAGEAEELATSGRFSRCESPHGVFDMSGNVAEWTEEKVAKGGSFASSDVGVRCASSSLRVITTAEIGFRCCANLK